MNFVQIIMLVLFLLPEASILYAPIVTSPQKQKQTIDFSTVVNTSEVKRSPKSKVPEVCSLENDKLFFTSFVRGKNNRGIDRNTYTASKVEIRNYDDPSKILEVRDGAYIFEHRDGCWYLTQELRSDKPETKKIIKDRAI
jgi:intein/homing endonuclease